MVYSAYGPSKWKGEFSSKFAVLDSGAEIHVSGHQSDFDSLSSKPDIALQGIDGAVGNGKPVAYRGWFKKNNLCIAPGVYFPGLGNERIISTMKLVDDGWRISLVKPRSHISHKKFKKFLEVDTSSKLPRLEFKIFDRDPPIYEAPFESLSLIHISEPTRPY